ncbi:MAG: PorT family protein [bacterium]|nr:PorT family protein [bacterium]
MKPTNTYKKEVLVEIRKTGYTIRTQLLVTILFCICAAGLLGQSGTETKKAQQKKDGYAKSSSYYRNLYERMQALYRDGKLEQVIHLYRENCHNERKKKEVKAFRRTNKEIRAEIYRLAALSYTALDMPLDSRKVLKKYLVIRHREGGDTSVWASVQKTAKKTYYVAPRLLLGLNSGLNLTYISPGTRYMVLQPVDDTRSEEYKKDYPLHYRDSVNSNVGLTLQFAFNRHFSIETQLNLWRIKFVYKNSFPRGDEGSTDEKLEFSHNHNLSYIEMPLIFSWRPIRGKLAPYIQLGGFIGWLSSATKKVHGIDLPDESYQDTAILKLNTELNDFNYGLLAGVGFQYKLNNSGLRFQLEVTCRYSLDTLNNPTNRFSNKELMYAFYDVFDDMKSRNIALTFKIMLPLSYRAFKN